jgi:hypothetical protein
MAGGLRTMNETEQIEVQTPFSPKEEEQILKRLNKLIIVNRAYRNDAGDLGIMDDANVLMVSGKTARARAVLSKYIEPDGREPDKIPALAWTVPGPSKFSIVNVSRALALLDATFETVIVNSAADYPISLENPDFRVVIAPRVMNE